jgi:predicted small metal-binding protein
VEVPLKEKVGRGEALVFVMLCASLGAGCFWRERPNDRARYVERHHGDHEERDHERRENERR